MTGTLWLWPSTIIAMKDIRKKYAGDYLTHWGIDCVTLKIRDVVSSRNWLSNLAHVHIRFYLKEFLLA